MMVSIITPIFKGEQFLPQIYQSLLNQQYQDFEWIIINDCSPDNSDKIIQDYIQQGKLNIRYINKTKNEGVAAARNDGIDAAQGKYIAFLDVDDSWAAEKLLLQVNFMQQNNVQLSYMDYNQVDLDGNFVRTITAPAKCNRNDMLKVDHLGHLTCLVSADLIQNIRFLHRGAEDYIFWLEVMDKIDYAYKVPTDKPLCFYRISYNSLSGNKLRAAKWRWQVYREILKFNPIKSLYYFTFYAINGVLKHKLKSN